MTNGELIDMLIDYANEFQKDQTWFERNRHLFFDRKTGSYEPETPITPALRATVLVGFLNHVANRHCMNLGLYLSDLYPAKD